MKNKLNSVMLIDDNDDDNFFHAHVIRKTSIAENILITTSAFEALEHLSIFEQAPQLIFLDINMPKMNGFDFLEAYKKMKPANKSIVIVMLTTSLNPIDREKAVQNEMITDFRTKPLTREMLLEITDRYFL